VPPRPLRGSQRVATLSPVRLLSAVPSLTPPQQLRGYATSMITCSAGGQEPETFCSRSLAQVSRNPIVRLNIKPSCVELESKQN